MIVSTRVAAGEFRGKPLRSAAHERPDRARRAGRGIRVAAAALVSRGGGPGPLSFETFSEDNDPHGQHDFGAFDHAGRRIFWKIDTYDQSLEFAAQALTGPRMPLSSLAPRSSSPNNSPSKIPRALRNNDRVGLGQSLQARREIWRLADDRLLLRSARADQIAEHNEPGGAMTLARIAA